MCIYSKLDLPPATRCKHAHESDARRMIHLVSVYSRGFPRLSLLCKSSLTSSLLNYLPLLMVIAHNDALAGHCHQVITLP
uniref:Uncharacterized protein n=1 Tax=Amphiprion ocellaris TaxID=80972 RepID=A0A3Q1AZF7_AMPOC